MRGRGRRAADTRGPAAAAASEGGERAGVSGSLGRLAGPRARAGAGWAELLGLSRPSPLLFSFLFFISSPLFEFKFSFGF